MFAHIAAFEKLAAPGTALFYNLGSGKPTSVLEVIRAVEKVTGKKVPYTTAPRRAVLRSSSPVWSTSSGLP